MSNALGVAAVTTAFGQRIAEALQAVPNLSASPELRWGRPGDDANFVGANLFLYRVTPNGARRNEDLATRGADGSVLRRPQVALDLDYLVSFHGDEAMLEPQRLMGSVIAALHAAPILSPERIAASIAASGAHGALAGAAYDPAASPIRFSLQALDLDAFYRIWSRFTEVPYALSLAYTGSSLLIEADLTPVRALPVHKPALAAMPNPAPVIRDIVPTAFVHGSPVSLSIEGEGFADDAARLLIGDLAVPATIERGTLTATLPPDLPAGLLPIRVAFGTGDAARLSAASGVVSQPRLADGARCARPGIVSCNIRPVPRFAQAACLFLNPLPPAEAGRAAYSTTHILRATLDPGLGPDLDGGVVTAGLRAALGAAGIEVATGTAVTVLNARAVWRLPRTADGTACRLVAEDDRITAYPGLAAEDAEATIAFALPETIAPGDYLASVQIGPDARATSPLRLGLALFRATAPGDPLDRGILPAALTAGFAALRPPVVFSPRPSVTRPMPGDGWQIQDGAGPTCYWVRETGGVLDVYQLDAPNARFFGPAVTIPGGAAP